MTRSAWRTSSSLGEARQELVTEGSFSPRCGSGGTGVPGASGATGTEAYPASAVRRAAADRPARDRGTSWSPGCRTAAYDRPRARPTAAGPAAAGTAAAARAGTGPRPPGRRADAAHRSRCRPPDRAGAARAAAALVVRVVTLLALLVRVRLLGSAEVRAGELRGARRVLALRGALRERGVLRCPRSVGRLRRGEVGPGELGRRGGTLLVAGRPVVGKPLVPRGVERVLAEAKPGGRTARSPRAPRDRAGSRRPSSGSRAAAAGGCPRAVRRAGRRAAAADGRGRRAAGSRPARGRPGAAVPRGPADSTGPAAGSASRTGPAGSAVRTGRCGRSARGRPERRGRTGSSGSSRRSGRPGHRGRRGARRCRRRKARPPPPWRWGAGPGAGKSWPGPLSGCPPCGRPAPPSRDGSAARGPEPAPTWPRWAPGPPPRLLAPGPPGPPPRPARWPLPAPFPLARGGRPERRRAAGRGPAWTGAACRRGRRRRAA